MGPLTKNVGMALPLTTVIIGELVSGKLAVVLKAVVAGAGSRGRGAEVACAPAGAAKPVA